MKPFDRIDERDTYDLWLLAQACENVSRFHSRAAARYLWTAMGGPDLPAALPEPRASLAHEQEDAQALRLVLDFIDARCVREPSARVQAGALHRAYCRWAADTKAPLLTPTRLGLLMRMTEHPKRNGRVVVYHGLRPVDPQDEKALRATQTLGGGTEALA